MAKNIKYVFVSLGDGAYTVVTWTVYTSECWPAEYWKFVSWINVMSRQWKELVVCPHGDLVCFKSIWLKYNFINPTDTKLPFQKQNVRMHNTLHIKQRHSKSVFWMFNWWNWYHICLLYQEDQMSQLAFQHLQKKTNRMSGKTVQGDSKNIQ